MASARQVYVTGSAGVLGPEIAEHLAQRPDTRVIGVARGSPDRRPPPGVAGRETADVFALDWAADLARDAVVIHCAGLSNPRLPFDSFAVVAREHVAPHLDMVEAMAARGWRGRLVYLSAAAVYGDALELPIREDHPTSPKSFYGLQKLCVERGLEHLAGRLGFELIVLRVANPYGARRAKTGQGVIPMLIAAFRADATFRILGDGRSLRDYLHVDDMSRAVAAAALDPIDAPQLVLNLGSGEGRSLLELIDRLETILGRSLRTEHVPIGTDVTSNVLDREAIGRRFGWWPQIAFEDGLAALIRRDRGAQE